MKPYRWYALDRLGRVNARQTLEGTHDNEVIGRAQDYLAQHPSISAIEIWLDDRYVGKLHQPLAALC